MFARYNSWHQILQIMLKTLCNTLLLIFAALLLTACPKQQHPTPSDTVIGFGQNGDGFGDDLVPTDITENYGPDAQGLELRDDQGIGNGYYTDPNGKQWEIVEGVLPSVYFGFDSSFIAPIERIKLQQAADHIRQNPTNALLIQGHCDWYGTTEYNLALGDRRANSVNDYLTTLGVNSSRLETLSKGSLLSTGGLSKTQSSKDRRVDLVILK